MKTLLRPGCAAQYSPGGTKGGLAVGLLCLAIALAILPGCSREPPPATVEGTLRLNGKPLENCLVTFLPEPGRGAQGPRSLGLTDSQGAYRLRRDNQQEGAATGWHRVTVQDLAVSSGILRRDHGAVDADVKENSPPPPVRRSRVAPRYLSPNDTPLRHEIQPGHQAIDLDLK